MRLGRGGQGSLAEDGGGRLYLSINLIHLIDKKTLERKRRRGNELLKRQNLMKIDPKSFHPSHRRRRRRWSLVSSHKWWC